MKKVFLFLFLFSINTLYSQKKSNFLNNLSIELGLNWIDNSGQRDPLYLFEDYENSSFNFPFKLELNYSLGKSIVLFTTATTNEFSTGQIIDSRTSSRLSSYTYLSIDFGLKHVVLLSKNLSAFSQVGLGLFHVETLGKSANIGAGFSISITELIGVVFTSNSKFKIDSAEDFGLSNHFQYSIGIRYSLSKN